MSVEDARRFIIERNPGFVAEVSSNLLQEAYCRYLNMLVKTPTERFHELVFRYPGVMHNLPIQEIASYLGISRRQLHRIREAESATDASECEDIKKNSSFHADFHGLMGHLSHRMSIRV